MGREWLIVLIPSRGRPQAAADLLTACDETKTHRQTIVTFGVDDDDPSLPEYDEIILRERNTRSALMTLRPGVRRGMVDGLNQMVNRSWSWQPLLREAFAFMGDDHRPRTTGWDRKLLEALGEHDCAVAYGNDLLQGENLATAVAMTASIPHRLGYMAPPELIHLYVDNVWMDWGRATHMIYLPDVVLEHMHPVAGKAEGDEGYAAVNSGEVFTADQVAYNHYREHRFTEDIKKLVAP